MRLHPHFVSRKILSRSLGLTASLLLALAAKADVLVAPNNLATEDYVFGAGTLAAANYHAQQVYGAQHFPPDIALIITELRFRPDRSYGHAFNTTIANIQVRLSTTRKNPDGLSTAFASNVGLDETLVFSGALPMSSQFTGPPGGPKDFDMIIPLSTPFLYNPAAGNLLIDVRNISGSTASPVSGNGSTGDAASRVGGSLASSIGGADSGVEALQIIYAPTDQPPVPPQPLLITRGPYLQNATTTNIIVRWRTSAPTNGVVTFGASDSARTWGVTNLVRTNNHAVTLTNLAPGTKYFYAIASTDTNLAGGSNYFFFTLPATTQPVRIWAMGDFGTTGIYGDGALPVRDAYYSFTSNRYTDIWLMLGDNAYPEGRDEEYQRGLFDVYPDMLRQTVAWSTIGNHETYGSNDLGHVAYYDIFNPPMAGEAGGVPSGTIHYYSFNYANIHFVCLDSELSDQTPAGPMATWLQEDLSDNTNEWVIAYWHSPPYTKGSHDSDNDADTTGHLKNMREVFLPILESHSVDLVLNGHSHIYERSFLLEGHYGKSWTLQPEMILDAGSGQLDDTGAYMKVSHDSESGRGTVYVVAGSGGFATGQLGIHPAMHTIIPQTGSLVIDVNGSRLDGTFLRGTGDIEDTFTIIKQSGLARPYIQTARVQEGTLLLEFKTIPGQNYQVEHATQLDPADWQPVSAIIPAQGTLTSWSSPAAAGDNHFYRVLLVSD